ncbi:uncharacterized protein LOC120092022 [Benincasa hispida]|uniref:uncharacterized protein LOC120092022 n=1 Tax=Benincasa hispida TaxID=102211 RepID=UPI001900D397|nr:uncharacterized protein LOC120092022 [Benincasa hispida]
MERGRMNGNGNCDYSYESNGYHSLDLVDVYGDSTLDRRSSGKTSQVASSSNCIVHPVSKLDTLAGVAIKYGVEVADIKKMNGLVTDFQMFALKSLQIPLPGRHPPSPCLLEGLNTPGQSSSEKTPSQLLSSEFFESFQSLKLKSSDQRVSPAMSSLQGYYGLKPSDQKSRIDGFEMAVYRSGVSHYLEDEPVSGTPQHSDLLTHHHRKSKSLVNGFLGEKGESGDPQSAEAGDGDPKWSDKLIRRRQKSVADFSNSPEMLLKDDNSSGGSNGFSSSAGKGLLAQRPKTSSRTNLASDNEVGLIPIPIGLGDSFVAADGFAAFRKSSSTSSLPDQENGITSSIWSQAISTASRPIFDGFPKPLTGRRNKAALD